MKFEPLMFYEQFQSKVSMGRVTATHSRSIHSLRLSVLQEQFETRDAYVYILRHRDFIAEIQFQIVSRMQYLIGLFFGLFYRLFFLVSSIAVSVNEETNTSVRMMYANAGESFTNDFSYKSDSMPMFGVAHVEMDVPQMKVKLEQIKSRLRSFVYDTVFDRLGYLEVSSDLAKELGEIESQIDKQGVVFGEAVLDFQFCLHLSTTFREAAKVLPFYESKDDLAQVLVFKTIQLNIKLLTLYKCFGVPDQTLPGFASTVFRYVLLLDQWHRIFTELHTHPHDSHFAFHIQYTQAKDSLQVLVKHVP